MGRSAGEEAVVRTPTGEDAGDTQPAGGEMVIPGPTEDPSRAGQLQKLPTRRGGGCPGGGTRFLSDATGRRLGGDRGS